MAAFAFAYLMAGVFLIGFAYKALKGRPDGEKIFGVLFTVIFWPFMLIAAWGMAIADKAK